MWMKKKRNWGDKSPHLYRFDRRSVSRPESILQGSIVLFPTKMISSMSPECSWLGRGEEDRSTLQGLQTNEGAPAEAPGMDLLPGSHFTRLGTALTFPCPRSPVLFGRGQCPQFACNVWTKTGVIQIQLCYTFSNYRHSQPVNLIKVSLSSSSGSKGVPGDFNFPVQGLFSLSFDLHFGS